MAANSDDQPAKKRRRGRGRPFPSGQSGNPTGRPKVVIEVQELARRKTILALNTLVRIARDESQDVRARVKAAELILDRGWGRPVQGVELAGADGGPLAVTWVQLMRKAQSE